MTKIVATMATYPGRSEFVGQAVASLADQVDTLNLVLNEYRAKITCTITEQFRNTRCWLEDDMAPVHLACKAAGIEPFALPIRGETDGSRLTEKGVPLPKIFTSMQMIHRPREWISAKDMAAAVPAVLELAGRAAHTLERKPQ
jgi:di/tripeptidase